MAVLEDLIIWESNLLEAGVDTKPRASCFLYIAYLFPKFQEKHCHAERCATSMSLILSYSTQLC